MAGVALMGWLQTRFGIMPTIVSHRGETAASAAKAAAAAAMRLVTPAMVYLRPMVSDPKRWTSFLSKRDDPKAVAYCNNLTLYEKIKLGNITVEITDILSPYEKVQMSGMLFDMD